MVLVLNRDRQSEETQAALLDNGKLVEIYLGHEDKEETAGSIYVGRVEKIIPALDAAFVKIGSETNAFLRLKDVKKEYLEFFGVARIYEGQKILVQVKKESVGNKGPQVTTNIALVGRYVILLPLAKSVGVSRKLDERERERLRTLAKVLREQFGIGVILRTAAVDVNDEVLFEEIKELQAKWQDIVSIFKRSRKPKVLLKEADSDEFLIREFLRREVTEVVTNVQEHRNIVRKFDRNIPVRVIDGNTFEQFNIEEKLLDIYKRRITLPSGGEIVVDKTEALTIIDVNSGRCVATNDHERLSELINVEAAIEICRVLRLRNIGGIVLIDFIDMKDEATKQRVVEVLKKEVSKDRNRVELYGFTKLGLFEMARKRTSKSLDEKLLALCPVCGGTGKVKSPHAVIQRLLKDLENKPRNAKELILKVHPYLKSHLSKTELKEKLKVDVHVHYTHTDPGTYEITWKI